MCCYIFKRPPPNDKECQQKRKLDAGEDKLEIDSVKICIKKE